MPCLSRWSFLPFRYPRLRSLSINRIKEAVICPFYAPEDRLVPLQGHKSLESLIVRSSVALTLLRNEPAHERLCILLPGLKSLEIETYGRFSSEMFQNVPPTVTKFHLSILGHSDDAALPLSTLKLLPATLLDLSTNTKFYTDEEGESALVPQARLPPSLTSLTISTDYLLPLVTSLPITIEYLRAASEMITAQSIESSLLPPRLTSLHILGFGDSITLDMPLPRSLTHLSLPFATRLLDSTTGKQMETIDGFLPPSLTYFNLAARRAFPNLGAMLPNLRTLLEYGADRTYESFTSLTSLNLPSTSFRDSSIDSLPSSLTHLSVNLTTQPSWARAFTRLINLRSLQIPISVHTVSADLWNCMHSRLETLDCQTANFGSVQAFNGPWTRLRALTLRVSGSAEMSSEWRNLLKTISAAKSLPKPHPLVYAETLERLTLAGAFYPELFWPPVARLPLLKELSLQSATRDVSFTPEPNKFLPTLKTLPSSLLTLRLDSLTSIEPEYLHNLPSGLKHLKLSYSYGESGINGWSSQHLASLPPRLETISIKGHISFRPSIAKSVALPPTLISFISDPITVDLKTQGALELERQRAL